MFEQMESAERAASERARQELVAFISLETMFPDKQVRALADAAGKGRIREIDVLVREGVSVHSRGTRNATPLFWALRRSNIKGFKKLLELGADPNVVFDDGGSVIHWAAEHRSDAFLRAALDHGGNPNLEAGDLARFPLLAALGGRRDRIDILLDAGADVDVKTRFGMAAVMLAAGRGSFDVVCKRLEHGADYSLKSSNGKTLADMVADVRGRMNPNHELSVWMERVIEWLEERGVHIPNKSDA